MDDTYEKRRKQERDAQAFAGTVDSLDSSELPTAKIMVAGITGSGKSTLINAVFGKNLAKTGIGDSVTKRIDEYGDEEIPIRIWDTVGLELDAEKTEKSIRDIKNIIAQKAESEDQFDRIHAIWYCINSRAGTQYQPPEQNFVRSLHSMGVPFIIVLTQCIGTVEEVDALEQYIREKNHSIGLNDVPVVQVCAKAFQGRNGSVMEAFGLEDLVDLTLQKLPDFIKGGFIAAQKVSKLQKRIACEDVIFEYVDAAQKGFWDKVPIINVFTTDSKILKMFIKIGKLYNTVLSESEIQDTINELGRMDPKNAFWGLISPVSRKYDEKVDQLFDQKKSQGLSVKVMELKKEERVARMLAYYGYTFLDAVEQLWEELNEELLRKQDLVLDRLKGILKRKLQARN